MKSLFERLQTSRLASTFTILGTLSAGILIGSIAVHGVRGNEAQTDSSDATPLKIPNPVSLSTTFTQIAKDVGPAVVNINTETIPPEESRRRRSPHATPVPPGGGGGGGDDDDQDQGPDQNFQDFFNRFFGGQGGGMPDQGEQMRESLGSGFIVDPKGYIITNNHVVEKADKIFVKLSTDPEGFQGRPGKVVGVDKDTDLAVVKITTNEPLPTVKMGNSDSNQVGDWVIAIGSPFALTQTVTAGIVSAKNRTIEKGAAGQFQHFIQTDAAINPGNSGGPLVNMADQVIGVNTAILTQSAGYEGIGFAMPSNTVISVYNDLIGPEHKVIRGSIGVQFQATLNPAVQRVYGFKSGVLVNLVVPKGPADQAGMKAGDIITTVDGKPIKDGDALVNDIAARKPGTTVKLGYLRGGQTMSATLTIADRAKLYANAPGSQTGENGPESAPNASEGKLGITVEAVPSALASKGIHGVLVTQVKPGSFADEAGLAPGLVITEMNRQPVTSLDQFQSLVSALKSGQDVGFRVVDSRNPTAGGTYLGGTLP
ncbi:MAG TPA: trypsin-like peptidase domain-containing protein [Acidobacteriaceae bacterium]|nr:trypsin-like peptidase domain-containing protein [Acidobacteriaceae bacterium]